MTDLNAVLNELAQINTKTNLDLAVAHATIRDKDALIIKQTADLDEAAETIEALSSDIRNAYGAGWADAEKACAAQSHQDEQQLMFADTQG